MNLFPPHTGQTMKSKLIQPDNFTSDRPYWYVECEGFTFRSNLSLDDAMRRWSMCGKPQVLCCGSVG